MAGGAARRYRLTLQPALSEALRAEAERRQVKVSVVVREALGKSLGVGIAHTEPVERTAPRHRENRRQCRLWLEVSLWDQLATEALSRGVSVASVIRERLRIAMGIQREGPFPVESGTEPVRPEELGAARSISLFDLSG